MHDGVVQMSPQREKGAEDPPQLPGGVMSRLLQLRAGQGLFEREDPCVAADVFPHPAPFIPSRDSGQALALSHRGRRDSCTDPRLCKGLHLRLFGPVSLNETFVDLARVGSPR